MSFKNNNELFEYNPKQRLMRSTRPRHVFSHIQLPTSGGQWRVDRKLMVECNPNYYKQEVNYFQRDKRMLLKRREGTIMKNMSLQQDLKVTNKRLDKELRNKIF